MYELPHTQKEMCMFNKPVKISLQVSLEHWMNMSAAAKTAREHDGRPSGLAFNVPIYRKSHILSR